MKNFKVAEIVTVAQLGSIVDNHYHMCLAHLVKENSDYAEFYTEMVQQGKYVLMDNGVAEGSQLSVEELLKMYEIIQPTEIVLPDTLNNAGDTLRKTLNFIEDYGDKLPYKFMGVPQGQDFVSWCDCVGIMLRCARINTIGVSKFLNITTGSKTIRYDAVSYIARLAEFLGRRDIEVHLLGCDEGPAVVKAIQEDFPIVRGCDSAFSYIACSTGTQIEQDMDRPAGEIDFLDEKTYYSDYLEYATKFEKCMGAINDVSDNTFDNSWR